MAIIDLLSILPSINMINKGFKVLKTIRLIRTFRVLRIFKSFRYSKNIQIILQVGKKLKEGFDCCSLFSYWLYFCLCPYYF